MSNVVKYLGYAWASPVTLFGLLYVWLFTTLQWYRCHGVEGDAMVWIVRTDKSPKWLLNIWQKWAGHAIGNVVVLKQPVAERPIILVHEQKHVDQCMRLGVFQPIAYAIIYVSVWIGCPGSNPYYSHSFEIDARRAAEQVIDVEGTFKKIKEQRNKFNIK